MFVFAWVYKKVIVISTMPLKNVNIFANGGRKLFLKVTKYIHKFVSLKNASYLLFVVTNVKFSKN